MAEIQSVRSRAFAAVLAAVSWDALFLQFRLSIQLVQSQGGGVGDALVIYLGYFTILSNLFVAFSASAVAAFPGRWPASPMVRGCATTAIVLVGLGYHLLLREIWDPQGWQRVADNLLHYAVPIGALAHWLIFPPKSRLSSHAPLWWAVYPAAYLSYALVRGAWLGIYPYPFIDVTVLGYPRVVANGIGLLVVFLMVAALLRSAAGRR